MDKTLTLQAGSSVPGKGVLVLSVVRQPLCGEVLDGELALQRVEEVFDERLPLRDHGIPQLLRRVLGKVLEREAGEGIEFCSVASLFVQI